MGLGMDKLEAEDKNSILPERLPSQEEHTGKPERPLLIYKVVIDISKLLCIFYCN